MDIILFVLFAANFCGQSAEPIIIKSEKLDRIFLNEKSYISVRPELDNVAWNWNFAHSAEKICHIRRQFGHGLFLTLTNVFTLEMTAPKKLLSLYSPNQLAYIQPLACFQHLNSIVVISRHRLYNYTSIQFGSMQKAFSQFDYEGLHFDHIKNKLYGIKENELRRIDLSFIEELWALPHERRMQIDSDLVASYGKTPMDLRIFDGWLLVDEGKGTAFVSPIFAQNKSHPFNLENNSSLPYFFSHPFIENSPNFCVPAFTPLIFIIMLGIILDSIIGYYTYKLYRRTKYFCFQSLELDLYKSTTFK
jgi:hypothetical protein